LTLKFLASFPVQEPSNITRGSKIVEASCMVGLEIGCKRLGVEVSLKKQRKKGHWHVLDTKSEPSALGQEEAQYICAEPSHLCCKNLTHYCHHALQGDRCDIGRAVVGRPDWKRICEAGGASNTDSGI
jgi:hypothetical protein